MILLTDGEAPLKLNVAAPKVGCQFEAIILDAIDVATLAALTSERLHDWLTHWQCGFKPVVAVCARCRSPEHHVSDCPE